MKKFSRRDFLKHSALAVAASQVGPLWSGYQLLNADLPVADPTRRFVMFFDFQLGLQVSYLTPALGVTDYTQFGLQGTDLNIVAGTGKLLLNRSFSYYSALGEFAAKTGKLDYFGPQAHDQVRLHLGNDQNASNVVQICASLNGEGLPLPVLGSGGVPNGTGSVAPNWTNPIVFSNYSSLSSQLTLGANVPRNGDAAGALIDAVNSLDDQFAARQTNENKNLVAKARLVNRQTSFLKDTDVATLLDPMRNPDIVQAFGLTASSDPVVLKTATIANAMVRGLTTTGYVVTPDGGAGAPPTWDHHGVPVQTVSQQMNASFLAVAGFLKVMKARGLDGTAVIFGNAGKIGALSGADQQDSSVLLVGTSDRYSGKIIGSFENDGTAKRDSSPLCVNTGDAVGNIKAVWASVIYSIFETTESRREAQRHLRVGDDKVLKLT